ncbi:hypothetical protein [Paludibaculum fermentans]|uniref:Binding-protein-dependent transport systems inner membrane component n=1 Tax=Paludibaculum fermentans TaxID=1473598 RepID=A0A7S7NW94_PALFE|nr:hypothetical protein [Paludibaculum fermentans]QOY90896.1 hypothetical protein IRI77_13400 [Paludibaculum fermentans]
MHRQRVIQGVPDGDGPPGRVIQTVPSLALLAFMVPALAALGMQSIGYLPALIGLCLYSVLPILRNTLVGLASIEPALLEAAQSVGMTPGNSFSAWNCPGPADDHCGDPNGDGVDCGHGHALYAVGAPSLGNYIFSGLQTRNYAAVLVGCVAAALLALALDGLIRVVELGLRLRRRALWIGALCVFAALAAWRSHDWLARSQAGSAAGTDRSQEFHRAVHPFANHVGPHPREDRPAY